MADDLKWHYAQATHGRWHDLRGHLPFLRDTAASYARPVIAEMGVRRGMSTLAFLAGTEGNGGQVYSVDIEPAQVPPIVESHPRWLFLQADDVSVAASEFIPPEIDVLFLDAHADDWDADQLTRHVYRELSLYAPRVRPGGVILAHDTQWEPPDTELPAPAGGVAAALDMWSEACGVRWENRPGFYGLGIMRIT